jgi:hypothetical protein
MQQISNIKAAFEIYFKHLMHGEGEASSVHSQQSHEDELIESASERERERE